MMEAITGLQDRMSRLEIANYDRENFRLRYDIRALNVTYKWTLDDGKQEIDP